MPRSDALNTGYISKTSGRYRRASYALASRAARLWKALALRPSHSPSCGDTSVVSRAFLDVRASDYFPDGREALGLGTIAMRSASCFNCAFEGRSLQRFHLHKTAPAWGRAPRRQDLPTSRCRRLSQGGRSFDSRLLPLVGRPHVGKCPQAVKHPGRVRPACLTAVCYHGKTPAKRVCQRVLTPFLALVQRPLTDNDARTI